MTDHTRRALDIAPFVLNTDEEQSLVQEALRLYGLPAEERSSDDEDAILSILRTASYCVITSGASYDTFQKAMSETKTRLAARIAAEEATVMALLQKDRIDHLTHCNQGDYEGSCKYGWEPSDCPAAPPEPLPTIWQVLEPWVDHGSPYGGAIARSGESLVGYLPADTDPEEIKRIRNIRRLDGKLRYSVRGLDAFVERPEPTGDYDN